MTYNIRTIYKYNMSNKKDTNGIRGLLYVIAIEKLNIKIVRYNG